MLNCGIPPAKIGKYLASLSGKNIKAKDIQNLKLSGKEEDVRLLTAISDIMDTDPSAAFHINVNKKDILESIYFQTSNMKKNYNEFPEVLILDTTYKVNQNNLHLTTLMVIDGNGHGQTVGHGLLSSESMISIESFLNWFVGLNSEGVSKTQCVLIDKDFSEIGAIEKAMPGKTISLCMWHVICAMKRRLGKEDISNQVKIEITQILQRLCYSHSIDEYNHQKENLRKKAPNTFMKYFDEHWDGCRDRWVLFKRREILNFGTLTTNYIESFHQKIKQNLSMTTSLPTCVTLLSQFDDFKKQQSINVNVSHQTKVTYSLKEECDISRELFQYATEYAAKEMLKHFHNAKKCQHEMKVSADDEDRHYTVNYGGKAYHVELGLTFICSCSAYKTSLMLCQHAFACIVKQKLKIEKHWLPPRWRRTEIEASNIKRPHIVKSTGEHKMPHLPANATKRYYYVMSIMKEIAGICSVQPNDELIVKVTQLQKIKDAWARGDKIRILCGEETEDTEEIFLEEVHEKDQSKEEVSICREDLNSQDDPNQSCKENTKNVEASSSTKLFSLNKTPRRGPEKRKKSQGEKIKATKKKKSESTVQGRSHLPSAEMFKFIRQQKKEDLKILMKTVHTIQKADSNLYSRLSNFANFNVQLIETNMMLSLIHELDNCGHDDLVTTGIQSLLNTVEELKELKDLTVQTNICHMMSAILVFAFISKISVTHALLSIKEICSGNDKVQIDWPTLTSKEKGGKFRIGNNTLTAREFTILQTGQWLNDRVSRIII